MVANRQVPPTQKDSKLAKESLQLLTKHSSKDEMLTLQVGDGDASITLPVGAVNLLIDILQAMAAGQGVTLIPENAELTTVEAANILNVSRPFLIKLLENKEIPYRKVGKHRRIRMEDVMRYKEEIDQKRKAILDQLVAEAQEDHMGYS